MNEKIENLEEKLIEKSKEAFIVAIELYNKPTIFTYSEAAIELIVSEIKKRP